MHAASVDEMFSLQRFPALGALVRQSAEEISSENVLEPS